MRTLICGSLAFDSIMVFQDHFKHHILPDKIHMLNVSFLVPEMRREYGGCAGNIAYNLKLLGGEPLIMATVGDDFAAYAERLDALAIPRDYI
ncbi:MAG: carbohydrate kinase family protein, partial [Proteobacteria bacterium]|nr:carbohydrate kinase family protein [Pseudomonadota bacterium]